MRKTKPTLTQLSSKLNFLLNPNILNPLNPTFHSHSLQTLNTKTNTLQTLHISNSKSTRAFLIPTRSFTNFSHFQNDLTYIIELIKRNDFDLESKLSQQNVNLSHNKISEILKTLNNSKVSASRFFNWVLSFSKFSINHESYNLYIDNLGRLDDFDTILLVLNELSLKKHCLTEKAFAFLCLRTFDRKNMVGKVIEVLNKVGGTCKGSGIYSMIKVLCGMNCFDIAVFVMEETAKNSSYYNVLIAAKCRNGSFVDAQKVLDEMRNFGCEPNMNSYNYLLGCLFKRERVPEACDLMESMEVLGCFPNDVTYELVVFHACMSKKIDFAMEFVNRMLLEGIRPRFTMHAAFIKGYFLCRRVDDAYKYVLDMSLRDKSSSNMNYSLFARLLWESGRVVEAGGILYELMEKGLKPNFPIYMKVTKDLYKVSRGDLSSQLKSMYSRVIPSTEEAV